MEKVVGYANVVIGDKVKVINIDWGSNYEIKVDDKGYVYVNDNKYNAFACLKPVESRGLYDLCIDNYIDIPDSISKDSPCYKQFMKEREESNA